jgi:hypothetical protein
MAISIWDIYNQSLIRVNKEQSGRSFSVVQFNTVAKFVNMLYLKYKIGLPESYQIGMPVAPQRWQVSQKISDDLRWLLTWMGGPDKPMLQLDQYGVAEVPTDYMAFSSCYYVQNYTDCDEVTQEVPRQITFVSDAVWADRMSCAINKPTFKYPIAKWFGDKIQFAPVVSNFVHFTYIRKPVEPFLAVTIDSNNDYVYDPANSVNFEYPEVCRPDIENLIFGIMTGSIQSQLHIQLAQSQLNKGV